MSDDEVLVLFGSLALAGYGWYHWYLSLINVISFPKHTLQRFILSLIPLFCLSEIYIVLKTAASFDVRDDSGYLFFYIVLGAAWLFMGREVLYYFFDISWRDDAIERHNPAAAVVVSGGLMAFASIYAGANIGDGPGWWCVIFTSIIAVIIWLILLGLFQITSHFSEKITIQRDLPTAVRIAGYLIGSGIILGRGAAGDWTSPAQTIIEFAPAWPVIILTLSAIFVEWIASKTIDNRLNEPYQNDVGIISLFIPIVWGIIYIALAILAIWFSPPLHQNPGYGLIKILPGVVG
jgi:hypothetical protein